MNQYLANLSRRGTFKWIGKFDRFISEHDYISGKDVEKAILTNIQTLNGKIVAECECDKVDYYEMEYYNDDSVQQSISIYDWLASEEWGECYFETIITNEYSDEEIENHYLFKESCLTFNELGNYVCPKGEINNFYALHLSNVKVFDKPKELSEYFIFNGDNTNIENWKPNKYAPQNMKVVYEFCEYNEGILLLPKRTLNKCILISIQPQHLVNILNGNKTIEVRKGEKCLKVITKN
jgi:predicted transcriptional regulator